MTVVDVPVTVDTKTAEDRGDLFVPTDEPVLFDTSGESIDPSVTAPSGSPASAPAPAVAPAPASAPAAAAPAVADEAEEVARQNGGQIPKSRFNEVNIARKAAEARAEALEAENTRLKAAPPAAAPPAAAPAPAAPTPPAFDVEAQERAYADAMLDGNVDQALSIRKSINTHILDTAEQRASVRIRGELTEQQTATALEEASNQAVVDFPFLETPEGATALRVIIATRDDYVANDGMKPHLALRKAVAEIAPRFAPAADTPSKELPGATPPADTRTAEALRRGATDSNLQPPAIVNGIGNRATQGRIDVTTMTEKEFEVLPEAEKKKLRGD
ncbi:MAG: hypothetical protein ABI887_21425 [Burkholderiales bacterium]